MAIRKVPGRDPRMRYITRMNYANAKCFFVRIAAGTTKLAGATFSFSKYGSEKKALVEAKKWRDEQVRKFAKKLNISSLDTMFHTRDPRSRSKVVGVSPRVDRRGNVPRVSAWRAVWTAPDERVEIQFSVAEYGYEQAFRKALTARYRALGKPVPRGSKAPPIASLL